MKRVALLVMGGLALAGCSSAVSPSALATIQPGMKLADVEAKLGRPVRIDHTETTGLTGLVYHYPATDGGDAEVIFINDAVFKAAVVPGGKSS
jgi:putative hemolysin